MDGITQINNFQWVAINQTGQIVALDDSPNVTVGGGRIVFSVSETDPTQRKCCATYVPGSTKSIFFHDSGQIWTLDPTAAPGSQWQLAGTNTVGEIDW